jgi:hypothetical protein
MPAVPAAADRPAGSRPVTAALPFNVGPSPRFGANPVADALRDLCVILAVLLVMWTIRVVHDEIRLHGLGPGQLERFAGYTLAAVSIAYTEVVVQGSPVTWRLPLNLVAVGLGFVGLYRMRRQQKRDRR